MSGKKNMENMIKKKRIGLELMVAKSLHNVMEIIGWRWKSKQRVKRNVIVKMKKNMVCKF